MAQEDISPLDYLIVVLRRKRLIAWATACFAAASVILGLVLPKAYKAESRILPPQRGASGVAAQLLSSFSSSGALLQSALDAKNISDLYVEMLKLRTVLDNIIDRFGLLGLYKAEYREDARKKLIKALRASSDKKSGIITVGVEDRDPERAARMANAFVEELKSLNKGLAIGEAAERRLFFEEQLREAKAALMASEEDLKKFQERTGALKVEEQAKSAIEGIAGLRAQIAAKEVEMKVMRTYATENNPDLQKSAEALSGLKAELIKLEAKNGNGHDPLMPTERMPSVGTEYMRKLRELKFNETLYELLSAQFEAAKLDEARDAQVIQVIDRAVPPEKKIRPRKALMALGGTALGFVFSVLAAFVLEYIDKAPLNGEGERIEEIKRHLSFVGRIKFRR